MHKVKLLFCAFLVLTVPTLLAQTYVGSAACNACHGTADVTGSGYNIYDAWQNSGHPYKFHVIENATAPSYPSFVVNFEDTWMSGLGTSWDQIAGVIGGFGWKVRFVDNTGVIVGTASSVINPGGGHNQFNFFGGENLGWVDYDVDHVNKKYNYGCFRCHTTGASPDSSWLPGYSLGTFVEQGVTCESCHGPGSDHVNAPSATNIDLVYQPNIGGDGLDYGDYGGVVQPDPNSDDITYLCGNCHSRGWGQPIDASGGFVRHHEQWDEFVASPHFEAGLNCGTCHNPHKRVLWNGDGITIQCATCHPNQEAHNIHPGTHECIECHMPFAAKSGTARGESGYKADVRSHLFRITPNTESMFTDDGSAVRDDDTRPASLDLYHACLSCHNDDPNDDIPDKTVDELAEFAHHMHDAQPADYVGSQTCRACHDEVNDVLGYNIYEEWQNSGHPYKFHVIENATAPSYPSFVVNFEDSWMSGLGASWDEIAGVIGGYGWKVRFVDTTGVIAGTASSVINPGGGHNQFNFYEGEDLGWVDYDVDHVDKKYNYGCFRCHTTGATPDSSWLPGYSLGNFVEAGVACEDCHGPGGNHVASHDPADIDEVYQPNVGGNGLDYGDYGGVVQPDPNADDITYLCGNCHSRGWGQPIDASGGFVRHHEQWDEFVASPHFAAGLNCGTCHDPHKRVLWGGDGIKIECSTCHANEATSVAANHPEMTDCEQCHMPYAAKSGAVRGQSGFKADVRSHLFRITVDDNSMFTDDGSAVRDDATRPASLDLNHVCLACHNDDPADNIPDMTLADAVAAAANIHFTDAVDNTIAIPTHVELVGNYPNPFNPSTNIRFGLPATSEVTLQVFDIRGRLVRTLVSQSLAAGYHTVQWNGTDAQGQPMPAGVYLVRLKASGSDQSLKVLLVK